MLPKIEHDMLQEAGRQELVTVQQICGAVLENYPDVEQDFILGLRQPTNSLIDFYTSRRIKNGVYKILDCFIFGGNTLEYPIRGRWLYYWRTYTENNHKGVRKCGLL